MSRNRRCGIPHSFLPPLSGGLPCCLSKVDAVSALHSAGSLVTDAAVDHAPNLFAAAAIHADGLAIRLKQTGERQLGRLLLGRALGSFPEYHKPNRVTHQREFVERPSGGTVFADDRLKALGRDVPATWLWSTALRRRPGDRGVETVLRRCPSRHLGHSRVSCSHRCGEERFRGRGRVYSRSLRICHSGSVKCPAVAGRMSLPKGDEVRMLIGRSAD